MSLVIGLGSNIGDAKNNLSRAISLLSAKFGEPVSKSRIYTSKAIGVTDQPDFLNLAIEFNLPTLEPQKVLEICLELELEMGRKRIIKWGPRCIDIDILFWGHKIISSPNLTIPHPELNKRSFVVLPVQELKCYDFLTKKFLFSSSFDNYAAPIQDS